MKNKVLIVACITIIEIANSIILQPDSTPNGLIFTSSEIIYIKNQTQKILYSIDTSSINEIIHNENLSECKGHIERELKKFSEMEIDNSRDDEVLIKRTPHLLEQLEEQIKVLKLNNTVSNVCIITKNISDTVSSLLNKIDKLKFADVATILEMVPTNRLVLDIKSRTTKAQRLKLNYPFEFLLLVYI